MTTTPVVDRISAIHLEEKVSREIYEKMFGLLDSYIVVLHVWSEL
jgi:hypothetical protein